MDEAYVIVLSAGVGIVAAWIKGYFDYSQTAKRELRVAALACLDRLEKLEEVRGALPDEIGDDYKRLPEDDAQRKTIEREFYSLGGRLNDYLNAIGGARWRARRKHFPLYQAMRPVLIGQQFQPIEDLIGRLKEATKIGQASDVGCTPRANARATDPATELSESRVIQAQQICREEAESARYALFPSLSHARGRRLESGCLRY